MPTIVDRDDMVAAPRPEFAALDELCAGFDDRRSGRRRRACRGGR